jgi:hypothetical protein
MTSRSSGKSSLLGPPTTVIEDEDSVVGDPPSRDENRPQWGYRNASYLRRANDTLVTELDDFTALAPPVARTIDEFNEELDTLVKSFNGFFSQKRRERHPLESTSVNALHPFPSLSTTRKATSSRPRETPPSSENTSPRRSTVQSTPARKLPTGSYTPSEPPPAPVETPGYEFPTPNRRRTRRTTAPRVDDTYTSTRQEPSPSVRVNPVDEDADELEDLYRTLREQEDRIRDLEIENEVLRTKLTMQPPVIQRIHRTSTFNADSTPTRFDPTVELRRDRPDISTIREEPDGRRNPSADSLGQIPSPYRTQTSYLTTPSRPRDRPPRHIQTVHHDTMDGFTPGTLFVAELATLMKIENAHYAPLSVIIDKHWDQLKHHFQS